MLKSAVDVLKSLQKIEIKVMGFKKYVSKDSLGPKF
jgi:hypothetical protein